MLVLVFKVLYTYCPSVGFYFSDVEFDVMWILYTGRHTFGPRVSDIVRLKWKICVPVIEIFEQSETCFTLSPKG